VRLAVFLPWHTACLCREELYSSQRIEAAESRSRSRLQLQVLSILNNQLKSHRGTGEPVADATARVYSRVDQSTTACQVQSGNGASAAALQRGLSTRATNAWLQAPSRQTAAERRRVHRSSLCGCLHKFRITTQPGGAGGAAYSTVYQWSDANNMLASAVETSTCKPDASLVLCHITAPSRGSNGADVSDGLSSRIRCRNC
jgi:hypothetical protein